ncbi:MAG: TIGR03960 family B12-binding radical SAM protein [bacterium]
MTHPYERFLPNLDKPARYLGGEYGAVRKDLGGVRSRFCLAFPDTYELGMSHLGLKVLYELCNAHPDIACERACAPWTDLEAELLARRLPLVSLENALPLHAFDVVGFSLQYELTFTTVLAMLELGGIPLRAADRSEDAPLVIAGGPVALHPEPVAPFFDLVLVGDGERALPELLVADAALRERGAGRNDRVAELACRPGIHAPARLELRQDAATQRLVVQGRSPAVRRVWEPDLDALLDSGGGPVPSIEAVFDRAAIEISRGCNQGCRFCQAGFTYRPMRERSVERVLEALLRRAQEGGYDEVSLTALSTADYSALPALLRGAAARLQPRDISLSVSSLRAVGLDGALLDDLRTGRAGSLTFAPEAGSQTLRDRINKRISEEGLLQTAREVAARGWTHIKLYFMVGLPGETPADVDAILDLAERVRQAARGAAHRRSPRITCAVNNFVPKPHTPLQWSAMEPAHVLAEKQRQLKHHPLSRHIGLRFHDIEMSLLEGRLARGDRRLADVVERAYALGARFDGWEDQFTPRHWRQAFEQSGLEPDQYLAPLPESSRLAWDHIDVGVDSAFLTKELRKLEQGRVGPACGVPGDTADHGQACLSCGLPCLEEAPFRAVTAPHDGAAAAEDSAAPGGPPGRLRLFFTKREQAAYLGHLDLIRHLPRILRRAGLRPAYSQGYNPRPRLQFTPPLPVGAEGLCEACEVWIHVPAAPPEPAELLHRLAGVTLTGLDFTGAQWLAEQEPALTKLCHGADYRLALTGDADRATIAARIAELVARPSWPVTRTSRRRKQERELDLRPSLLELKLAPEAASTTPPGANRADGLQVEFALVQRAEGTLRPRELLEALLPGAPLRLCRTGHFTLEKGVRTRLRP